MCGSGLDSNRAAVLWLTGNSDVHERPIPLYFGQKGQVAVIARCHPEFLPTRVAIQVGARRR